MVEHFSSIRKRKEKSSADNLKSIRKAVIYVRVSDVKQLDGVSLDTQENEIRAFLKNSVDENGKHITYEVDKVFREEGKSGKDQYRDKFQEMIKYVRDNRKDIDGVCFYAISRLGRNVRMVLDTIDDFNKLDVTVLSKSDSLNSKTANGRFTLTILSALAQLESEQIAERVMPNMITSVRDYGRWQGARYVPYGYKHEINPELPPNDANAKKKMLLVEPDEARQVKQIFEWYCDGIGNDLIVGEYKIAKHLNEIGWKYRKGKEWQQRQIQSILKNGHLYTGWLVWNRHGTENKMEEIVDDYGIVRDKEVMKPTKEGYLKPVKETYRKEDHEIIIAEGIHEAIISEALWAKVVDRLNQRSQKDTSKIDTSRQAKHLFTHVLKCPQCRGTMAASTLDGQVYYKCQKAARGGMCKHNMIREDYIRETILNVVLSHYESYIYKRFDEIVGKESKREKYQTDAEAQLAALDVKIAGANKRMAEIVHEYQSDSPKKLIKTREQAESIINQIDGERSQVQMEMDEIKSEMQERLWEEKEVEDIVEKLKGFSDIRVYFDSLTTVGQMDFVDRYVKRIEYTKEEGKKGAHAYEIKKIVLMPLFFPLFDFEDKRFVDFVNKGNGTEEKSVNEKINEINLRQLSHHVRTEIGGVIDPNKSNLKSVAKIVALQSSLPIYYLNDDGKEYRPSARKKFQGFINGMNPSAKRELTKFLKSNSSELVLDKDVDSP
ncbi:hypothetical protein BK120_19760 [Paenibacillus sp. FSL A5-0031]|uniref:recombinase family protein n=1 Tax=Paenibacillus sp. FSL A5-0031 TaxID=1920420 RepID=UPI00096F8E17|nr:recombinase family protein [Paenibacillus sp. FSL A5-0031]OME80079.1 hypothetical protein BK120_19760 [Paenibacillus sp. FSL A5-0031]